MSVIIVPDRAESHKPLTFRECKNGALSTVFLSDVISDVREFEFSIMTACELFQKAHPKTFHQNVYILLKYDPHTWTGGYSVSNIPHNTRFVSRDYQFFEVNRQDVEKHAIDAYDGDGVCLEAIIAYSGGEIKIVPLCISKDIEGSLIARLLQIGDVLKRYARWCIPMLAAQGTVALISYLVKGDPKYYLFSISGFLFNKAVTMFNEEGTI